MKLNNRTLKDSYSLPRIEHVLDQLLGSTIFTTLDFKAGYWQVEMVEECKPYTAFTCGPLGFYECDTNAIWCNKCSSHIPEINGQLPWRTEHELAQSLFR